MKIRTDFVTNSSSSSYVCITLYLKTGESLETYWESGNIDMEHVDHIELTEKDYLSFNTGKDVINSCKQFIEDSVKKWKQEFGDVNTPPFEGNIKEIEKINNIKENVNKISIESSLDIYEPVYEAIDSYNYLTKKHISSVKYDYEIYEEDCEDSEEEIVDKKKEKKKRKEVYYCGGTFEDDIYNEKIEQEIIEHCQKFKKDEMNYVVNYINNDSYFNPVSKNDNGKEIYESIARFYAKDECSLSQLHDPTIYHDFLDAVVDDMHRREKSKGMFDYPEEIICNGLSFVTSFFNKYQERRIKDDVIKRNGFYKTTVSGKTDVLIIRNEDCVGVKLDKAIELKKTGKDIKIITYRHYYDLLKNGKLK